jgi:signal transduction histidine kinase
MATGNVTRLSPAACDPVRVRGLIAEDDEVLAGAVAAGLRREGMAVDVANASHELRTPPTRERALLQVTLANPASTTDTWQAVSRELLASNAEADNAVRHDIPGGLAIAVTFP